jgi:glucose/arabinose dehydrogenase
MTRSPLARVRTDIPRWMGYLYAPLLPALERIKVVRRGERDHEPRDILLPAGYAAEVVASGLHAPVHCCFDDQGRCYVSESGHASGSPPRVLRVDLDSGETETVFQAAEDRWIESGALTGACWYDGSLYVTNTDTVARVTPGGEMVEVVSDLPGRGDHQVNHPLASSDGWLYFGVGSATNSGVVGPDDLGYGWLRRFPDACDVPAHDVELAGRDFESHDVLGGVTKTVRTGAFVPYGTTTSPGQVIPGRVKCNGSVLRCRPDGSDLQVVAWGLRNPFGLAFHPDGRLFATEHGMDERSRHVVDDPDDLYVIEAGAWYGWPDFASGVRLDDPFWGEGGVDREPVLASHPDPHPPAPYLSFQSHAAANGLCFSSDPRFGFEGDAFVALFGDLAPVTTPRLASPAGFKVARVDMAARRIVDFAVNRIAGPASKLPHGGFERPSHVEVGPDGALYVVDFGVVNIAPEVGGLRMRQGTGTLWRIRATGEPRGELPPEPVVIPLYALQMIGAGLLGFGALVAVRILAGRRRNSRDRRKR